MGDPSAFIGLVSHSSSRFIKNQEPEGLAASLYAALIRDGFYCQLQVNTRNLFDENPYALTGKMARDSVIAEVSLEFTWSEFLLRPDRFRQIMRILSRRLSALVRFRSNSDSGAIQRLLNIEASHLDLYRNAILSGCEWTIILEDDAFAPDVQDLTTGLVGIFSNDRDVKFVNLSASYSLDALGIAHLLSPVDRQKWSGSVPRQILESSRPATNTVCAIAFKTQFLEQLVVTMDLQPQHPIIPIDWKLNDALVRMWNLGQIGPNQCWFVEPAPIIQLSMSRTNEDD
jgi:hypothetical protein